MEIGKSLLDLLQSCPGATTMFLTDREGVLIHSVGEENRSRQALIASHQATSDQMSKLVMGSHNASVFFYEHSQLVVLSLCPITVFVIATPQANTGQLLKLREKLEPLIQQIESLISALPGGNF